MYCPFCGHVETKVTDSRLAGEGRQIRRRRECLSCGERFTTFETAELVMPMVVKGDRSREVYDEAKLRSGMEKALEKRPVAREQLDEAVSRITHKVRSLGDREVQSRAVGELVMDELRQLDEVAYVRFASVYRHFEDVEAFHDEIQRLRSQRAQFPPGRRSGKREPGRDANRDQLPLLPVESAGKSVGSAAREPSESSTSPGVASPARSDSEAGTQGAGHESAAGVTVDSETK
jgi:transcriptional repressor NrdR